MGEGGVDGLDDVGGMMFAAMSASNSGLGCQRMSVMDIKLPWMSVSGL